MSSLRQLQQNMQNFLLTTQPAIYPQIIGSNPNFITERLAIYSDAYLLRLQEILASAFPGVRALAGEELFNSLAESYLTLYPSTYANARYLGKHLAGFLTTNLYHQTQPELAEMAKFEWMIAWAEDAADKDLLVQSDLAEIAEEAWPELCFKLHPSVQFIELTYNIPEIWQAAQAEQPLPETVKKSCQTWTIWRHELVSYYYRHNPLELCFLKAVADGKTFKEICEELSQHLPVEEAAQQAVSLIITFLNNQMFIQMD